MAEWRDIHADQNLRLAQKMLEQQGEINALKAELSGARATIKQVRAVCEGDKAAKDAYDIAADVLIALDAPQRPEDAMT